MGAFRTVAGRPGVLHVGEIAVDDVIVGELFDETLATTTSWLVFKLELSRRWPKRAYRFGWNRFRMSRTRDAVILQNRDPAIYAAVERLLAESYPPGPDDMDTDTPAPGERGHRRMLLVRIEELAERVAVLEVRLAEMRERRA